MKSTRPYLIRAFYEWIIDNDCTPYIVVDAEAKGVNVPRQYVQDGRIILNISPVAVTAFNITNSIVEFTARFSGVGMHIYAPPSAVLAIYAKENGRGMVFSEDDDGDDGGDDEPPAPEPTTKKPHLKVIK